MIDSYLGCPSKFKQLYLDDKAVRQESLDLSFGSALHLALKSHFDGEDPYSVFDMYWKSVAAKKMPSNRFNWDDLGDMAVNKFLPNFIKLHSKKFQNVVQEETIEMPFIPYETIHDGKGSFKFQKGMHTLSGTFDVACMYEGKLSIIDYKTSASEYPRSKIIRNPQMYIYAKLYEHKYGILPEQLIYKVFIKSEKRIQTQKIELTKAKLDTMMLNVEGICKDILNRVETRNWYSNYSNCFCISQGSCFNDT